MRFDYPYTPDNVKELVGWFEIMLKNSTGRGFSNSSQDYPRFINQIKHFMNKEGLEFEEMKTLLWGVFNEKPKMYSPCYSFYFKDDLYKYKKMKEIYEEKELEKMGEDEEEEFDDTHLQENDDELEEDYFNDL